VNAVAAALGRALGKPVRYVAIPLEAQDQALVSVGLDEWMVTMFGDYMNAYSQNWGNTTTDEVRRLLGRPAHSIDDFARDFAAVFR
jgi:NAD(P)H dehydrogenase (quinone)